MKLPAPEPGLVIRYSYLWLREHREGREEGNKERPCSIVLTLYGSAEDLRVVVVPVTHSPPHDPGHAMEIPQEVKRHLNLDFDRSWIVLDESNLFIWPGPDLRPLNDSPDGAITYGFLPPRFFAEMKRRFLRLEQKARSVMVIRTE